MANKAEPDKQSEIKEFTIQAAKDEGRRVDIRGGLSSFSYYETILSNIVTAQFQILDSGQKIQHKKSGKKDQKILLVLDCLLNILPITML